MRRAGGGGSPRAPATAALGAVLILVGLGFGIESALLAGIALIGLAAVALAWVELATRRGRLEREPLPRRVAEGEPFPLRIRIAGTLVPHPAGPSPTRSSSPRSPSGRAGGGASTGASTCTVPGGAGSTPLT